MLFLTWIEINAQKKEFKKAKDTFQEIGILAVSVDVPLEIYANPKDKQYLEKIVSTRYFQTYWNIEISYSLQPFINAPNYYWDTNTPFGYYISRLKFRVLKSTDKYFEVFVNDETKEIGYIKKEGRKVVDFTDVQNEKWYQGKYETNYFIFTTWLDFLKGAEFIGAVNCDLYDELDGNIIDKFERKEFKVIDLQGDWLKVIQDSDSQSEEKAGWIKWKDNGNLRIYIVEFTISKE